MDIQLTPLSVDYYAACLTTRDHIWSRKRQCCVMCGLDISTRGSTIWAGTKPKSKNRPKFKDRPKLIARLAERDRGMWCWYCTIPLDETTTTIDHAEPLAGGRHFHRFDNFRLCCGSCNHKKGDLTESQYRDSRELTDRQRYVARLRVRDHLYNS